MWMLNLMLRNRAERERGRWLIIELLRRQYRNSYIRVINMMRETEIDARRSTDNSAVLFVIGVS